MNSYFAIITLGLNTSDGNTKFSYSIPVDIPSGSSRASVLQDIKNLALKAAGYPAETSSAVLFYSVEPATF